MKYQQMYNQIAPNLLQKYGDGEKAFQEVMKVQRKSIPIKRFNEELASKRVDGEKYEGPLLQDKFTPTEKKERAALGLKIREKMARYAIARHVSQKQADELLAEKIIKESSKDKTANGDRYPEELMFDLSGKPGAAEKNAEISALFINASDAAIDLKEGEKNPYEKEFNEVHEDLVKEFEAYNVDDLISRNLSDAELIEHFEVIERSKGFCLQVQNIRDCYREMKIDLPPELKKRMDALVPKFRILETYEQRLGVIDSPYYSEIDPEDPALAKIEEDVVGDEVVMSLAKEDPQPEEFAVKRGEFFVYSGEAASFNQSYYSAEAYAMGEMLQQMGAKRENIVFEIDGKLSKEPYYQPDTEGINLGVNVLPGLNSGEIKSLRIFDKTDPTREIKVPKTNEKNYQFNKMLQGKTSLNPPQPPKEVPKPGFFTKLFNSWFGVFQKDIDTYKKYQDDLAALPAKQAAFEEEKKALNSLEKTFKTKKGLYENIEQSFKDEKNIVEGDGLDTFEKIYGAKDRKVKESWTEHTFAAEHIKHLEEDNIDLEKLTPNGKKIDNRTFATVSAMCALAEPFVGNRPDQYNPNTGKKEGKTPDSMMFEDLVVVNHRYGPRPNFSGIMEPTIDPARHFVAQCLENFDKEIPGTGMTGRQKLAKTMAEGIKSYVGRAKTYGWGSMSNSVMSEVNGTAMDFIDQMGMAQDIKDFGVTDNELEDIKTFRECGKIVKEAEKARIQLEQESRGELKLTEEQRLECINSMALGKVMEGEMTRYFNSQEPEMELPEQFPGETKEEYDARSMEHLTKITAGYSDINKMKEISPLLKDAVLHGGKGLQELAEQYLPKEKRQELAKTPQKNLGSKMRDDATAFFRKLPAYEKKAISLETEKGNFAKNQKDLAVSGAKAPGVTDEQIKDYAVSFLVADALGNTPPEKQKEKFEKGVAQFKASEEYAELSKNVAGLRKSFASQMVRSQLFSELRQAKRTVENRKNDMVKKNLQKDNDLKNTKQVGM